MYFPSKHQVIMIEDRTQKRMFVAILFSLLVHAFILSLQFGMPGIGVPSIELPWNEKRAAPVPLQIKLTQTNSSPSKITPTTSAVAKVDQAVVAQPNNVELKKTPLSEVKADLSSTKKIQKTKPVSRGELLILAPTEVISQIDEVVKLKKPTKPLPKITKTVDFVKIHSSPLPALSKLKLATQVITQDLMLNNDFIIPVIPAEELDTPTRAEIDRKQELEAIPAELLIDKNVKSSQDIIALDMKEEMQKQAVIMQEMTTQLEKAELAKAELEKDELKKAALEKAKKIADAEQEYQALQKLKKEELLAQEKMNEMSQKNSIVLNAINIEQLKPIELSSDKNRIKQAELKRLEEKEVAELKEENRLKVLAEQEQKKIETQKQLALEQAIQQQKEVAAQAEKKRENDLKELVKQKEKDDLIAKNALEKRIADQKAIEQNLAVSKAKENALSASGTGKPNEKNTNEGNRQNNQDAFGINIPSSKAPLDLASGSLANRLRDQVRAGNLQKPMSPITKIGEEKNNARKRSFLGAYDKEVPLRMYVDSLKNKLERNGNLIYAKRSVGNDEFTLLVNMVIRSDGSIDDVIIVRSSGSSALDEKVKNIILANAPYAKFPPNVAAKYDVIDVQRVWKFGDNLRIYDEIQ
jgi:hypothetical protein